ncbi:hypothetical protein ACFQ77_21925 [Streptomyces virginiae]|uniref:hypothetical protein n=1 Tax=Streptomyces virginiae TaxID=1961 RepID=UPI0036A0861F
MTEPHPADDDNLHAAAAALVTAFENLGPEHQALVTEEKETAAKERQGTVRRMIQSVVEASRILVNAMELLAEIYGMQALGIRYQMAKDADGRDYSPLLTTGNPNEKLYDTALLIRVIIQRLGEAYEPTKKYPALAVARKPQAVGTVLSSLRTALTSLSAEMSARDLAEDAAEFDPDLTILDELESRVIPTVPIQTVWPSQYRAVATELYDKLLSMGIGSTEREVTFWLICQGNARPEPGVIAGQLDLKKGRVEEALEKLTSLGVLRDDGTVVGVYHGPAPT